MTASAPPPAGAVFFPEPGDCLPGSAERLPIAPRPPAVSVRSVEASGPGFLDCLPTIVVCRIVAVGGVVAAVIRAGVVAAVVRAPIIAISATRDRSTD